MTKKWWKSKLIWAGVIQAVIGLSMLATGEKVFDQAFMGEFLLGTSGIVTIVFRLLTSKTIE